MRNRRLQYVLLVFGGLAVLVVGFLGCIKSTDEWEGKGGPPRVVVSFPPLYSFVKNVGGDHVAVVSLCTGNGPHHFESEAKDHRLLARADLFFANGLALDDKFADALAAGKTGSSGFFVKLGDRLPKELVDKFEDEDKPDPHVWLGIPQAVAIVDTICDELKRVDPTHKSDYDRNAGNYKDRLKNLQAYGKDAFASKKDKQIISFHESLHYFAQTYGLNVVAVIEDGPGDEPTSAKLVKLVDTILEHKIHVIAVEPQYPKSTSAEVLLNALRNKDYNDLQLVEVDPLETAEAKDLSAELYENTVRQNIDNLAKHLK